MDVMAKRAVTDMDRAKKMHLHEEMGTWRQARKFGNNNRANSSSKAGCFIPVSRKTQRGNMTTLDHGQAHEPRVVQLNLKPSLMGVQIYDDSERFFTRQWSTSSLFSLEKKRPEISIVSTSSVMSDAGKSLLAPSGTHLGEKGSRRLDRRPSTTKTSFEKFRAASGVLYPAPQATGNANSSILNAVHFTHGTSATGSGRHVTDKIYKELLEHARPLQSKCPPVGGFREMMRQKSSRTQSHQTLERRRSSTACVVAANVDKQSDSPAALSTPDPRFSSSTSLTFSERLFGYEFSRDSFRRQSQPTDAKSATKLGSNARQLNTHQLAAGQCKNNAMSMSKSIPAAAAVSDYEDTDDDDIIIEGDIIFDIPSEVAFRCHRPQQQQQQQHYAELMMVRAKPRPSSGRWSSNKKSSNKKSFNLNWEQQPGTKSTVPVVDVNGSSQQHRSTSRAADPESRDVKARAKLDVSHRDMPMASLRSSFEGESRGLKKGTLGSSFASERSGWLEFEAEMDDFVLDSGRLKIDGRDLDKPYVEQVHHGRRNKLQGDGGAKMDENDFPFNSPVASSFVFGEEGGKTRSEDHAHQSAIISTASLSSMAKTVVLEMDFDNEEDVDLSDAFRDPEDESISDTDSSLTTFSLEADSSMQGQMDQHTQWVSTRSFQYLREVVDHNSGFLSIESRSGRFSVDLRQSKRLDKVEHAHHSRRGRRVSMMKSTPKPASSGKRSLLAPCLVCLSCIHRPAQEQP